MHAAPTLINARSSHQLDRRNVAEHTRIVQQRVARARVGQRALDEHQRAAGLGDHEIYFSFFAITEIPQLELAVPEVGPAMRRFEEMTRDHVLETSAGVLDDGPVPEIEFALLLERPCESPGVRRDSVAEVQPIERIEPLARGVVTNVQLLAERVDRQRRPHSLGEEEGEVLDHSQVPDLREIAEVFANEEGSLSLLRIVADIEAEFGIHIPDEAFHTLRTLRTLRALLAHVEKPAAAA